MEIPGYLMQKEIGRGGMATVYLAIQESLNRPVALKIMDNVDVDKSLDMTERFMAEGRIIVIDSTSISANNLWYGKFLTRQNCCAR